MSFVVLVDADEGDFPDTVWVEADSENQARDRAAEFCADENSETPYRPVGPASEEWVTLPEPDGEPFMRLRMWKVSVY